MNTGERSGPVANDSSLSKIEPSEIIDLIVSKQTQYYTLWGVYTAVQFAAGSYGYGHPLPLGVGLAVLCGVWAFNIGHLGFVLRCVQQLNKLTIVLKAAIEGNMEKYQSALKVALSNMNEGAWFWRLRKGKGDQRSYFLNLLVHLFINLCASVALFIRVDNVWIQDHLPTFLR